MRHVPPPLAALTAQAQTLTAEGDLAGARAVLAGVLDPAETDPQRASPDLALAAALQARILIALGDAHAARVWAGFAHAAEERLHGPHDERTIAAAATHAAVLHRVGNHGRAAQLYHDLVGELTALDGRLSPRVLAAEADLAIAEHAAGHCTAARARLTDTWTRYREVYGDATAGGIKMLARLGAMERECSRPGEATAHLTLAQEFCARYLPADHSLAQQVARLAGSPPSGRHRCGRVQRSTGPDPDGPVAGVTRVPATAPDALPARQAPEAPGDPTGRHARPEPPIPLPLMSPAPARPAPGEPVPPAAPVYFPPAQQRPGTPAAEWPAQGHVAQVLAGHGEAVGTPRTDPPGPFPPDSVPATVAAPGTYPPGPRLPVDRASAPVVERRLPVPVEQPTSRQPFILAAVLVAGVAAAAAVVAVTLPRGDRAGTAPPPAPATGTTAGGAPSAAPSPSASIDPRAPIDVKLRDNRDSVSLTWRYPKGSEGPVLISGGRRGQEQRAFQQLAAGTTDYVVYGLNEQNDYCFTVAVVYTVDEVAASQPVCTTRK
ncbi:fibronectin type III domain-containing protein [Actinoplanes sp. NPDC049681]|uniref:fibronectin type III domain-containing protein n=1 Tax=Actinoplanes sp. NPDC049681 TaxID=3363905 RepID=UPI00378CC7B7